MHPTPREVPLQPHTVRFYRTVMQILNQSSIPFLVGGSYALVNHTQMPRRTKDLDLFVLPCDVQRVLETLGASGYQTELTFSHWLGKVLAGDDFVDVIFNSGNGLCPVDETWFEHALDGIVVDMSAKLCPLEESIWQKAFIMERHRYDGADVAHLLRAGGGDLDWQRLLARFGDHWRVLFSHLALFGFIYPGDEAMIPEWVRDELTARYVKEAATTPPHRRVCGGTLLSSVQYRGDLAQEGFEDGRLAPHGNLTSGELETWMASFDEPPTEPINLQPCRQKRPAGH